MRFFAYAKNMADMSDFERNPMGCVIVYKNKVLNATFNTTKTHPIQKEYNKARFEEDSPHKLHAEIRALIPLLHSDIDWKRVEIYICRKRKDREFGLARPCPSCMKLIKELGIRNIYYTTNDGYAHEKLEEK